MTRRISMVIANQFEDSEAISPKEHLESLGAEVTLVGADTHEVTGKKGAVLTPDHTFQSVGGIDQFDMLIIPGGGAPENLRIIDEAVAFTKAFVESGKPVASICHGPQLLISAKVLNGRTTTCVKKIRDDVTNAGATYVDEALVIDGNLISSRTPADLDVFNKAIANAVGL